MPHSTTMLVVPAVRDGRPLRIADPQSGQYLPATGAVVPRSAFWLRRLKDGDVQLKPAAKEV